MKFCRLLIPILLLTACGRRSINVDSAVSSIVGLPQEVLTKGDIDVESLRQVGGSQAIVETRLETAFRLEKIKGTWIVREVRIGHGQWEKIADLSQALEAVKIGETRESLDQIAEALLKYREINGRMPVFKDYVSLSDLLSPKYLASVIRLDAWRRPLEAEQPDAHTILLRSVGPDGRSGTKDDICKTITP